MLAEATRTRIYFRPQKDSQDDVQRKPCVSARSGRLPHFHKSGDGKALCINKSIYTSLTIAERTAKFLGHEVFRCKAGHIHTRRRDERGPEVAGRNEAAAARDGRAVQGGGRRQEFGGGKVIQFTVYGRPEPQGSTRAFIPKGWKRATVTSDNPEVEILAARSDKGRNRSIDKTDRGFDRGSVQR